MASVTSTATVLQRPEEGLVLTTRDRDWWEGVTLRRLEFASDFSIQRPARSDCYAVAYFLIGKNRLVQKRCGKIHEGRIFPGMVIIVPRGCDAAYEGDANSPTTLHIPHELVSRAADEIGGRTRANYEITNVFETYDATIAHLTNLLLIDRRTPGRRSSLTPFPAQWQRASCAPITPSTCKSSLSEAWGHIFSSKRLYRRSHR